MRVACLLLAVTTLWLNSAATLSAGGPAGKSRYRSNGYGRASQGDETNAQQPSKVGMFNLRALLPGSDDDNQSSSETLIDSIPLDRLTHQARQRIAMVSEKPSIYRRLPTQAIRCDEELFLFLTRKPETIIGIWDVMGITQVQATRTGPYEIDAVDGCGTTCKIDLIYGDRNLHVFVAEGMYDGKFVQKPIRGKGIFVVQSSYAKAADGSTTVMGTLDCFIKFESLGADLVARSMGGLIGKSADHNFVETAKFISQISQASETNPDGMLELVDRLQHVDPETKTEFARVVTQVANRYAHSRARNQSRLGMTPTGPGSSKPRAARMVKDRGITTSQR